MNWKNHLGDTQPEEDFTKLTKAQLIENLKYANEERVQMHAKVYTQSRQIDELINENREHRRVIVNRAKKDGKKF